MASQVREELAGRLLALYKSNRSNEWRWYEEGLSYCNAAIPHAMLICGQLMANKSMFDAGLESLSWLADLQRADAEGRHFVPIGSNGFYGRGGERARFDQQPVEAQAMVSACLEAYRIIGDKRWRREARRAFDWFLGRNDLNLPIYDPKQEAAVTVCIPTARTKIREQNLHWHFCRPCLNCEYMKIHFLMEA